MTASRSSAGAARWLPTSLATGDALAFAAGPGALYAAIYDDGSGGVYRSADGGASWAPASGGLPAGTCVTTLLASPTGLLAGTVSQGLFRSHDDGASWQAAGAGLPPHTTVVALAAQDAFLFAGTENAGVYRSADGGATWRPANAGLPLDGANLSVLDLAAGAGTLFASHAFGLHRSTDHGQRWQAVSTGLPVGTLLLTLQAHSDGSLFACSPRKIYRMRGRDGWATLNDAFAQHEYIRTLAMAGTTLFVGTQGAEDSGVYRSADGGASWAPLHTGLPRPTWSVNLAAAEGQLLAGAAARGVWRLPLPRPAAVASDALPLPFSLSQNSPNPFQDATSIPFILRRRGRVVLAVCDVQGREVSRLLDTEVSAGSHRVPFNGAGLAAGFYTYRLTMEGMSQARQMLRLP